jgi:hypothetical protein
MRFEVAPACENTDFNFTYFLSPVVGEKIRSLFHLTECMGNKSAMPRYKILPIKSRFLKTDAVRVGDLLMGRAGPSDRSGDFVTQTAIEIILTPSYATSHNIQ